MKTIKIVAVMFPMVKLLIALTFSTVNIYDKTLTFNIIYNTNKFNLELYECKEKCLDDSAETF